jgi:hypothetical protein
LQGNDGIEDHVVTDYEKEAFTAVIRGYRALGGPSLSCGDF